MFNLVDLTGKKIVVTGASKGIGRAVSIMLSKLGAKIIMMARNVEALEETKAMLEGEGHCYYVVDLGNVDCIEGISKSVFEDEGAIDGIVYCAGISKNRNVQQAKPDYVNNMMSINFYGFFEMVRCFTKKKRFNEGMRIVVISSSASIMGGKSQAIYSASKGAINSSVRSLAIELADKKIGINSVLPGMIHTDMYEEYLATFGADSETNKNLMQRQYLGIGDPMDVASAVAYLVSPTSHFITGVCIPVDGGFTSN